MELVKTLKKKYQKTVYRRINKGARIEYDESKGIVDEETKEVIISLDKIMKDEDEEDDDNDNDNDEEPNDNDKEGNDKKEDEKNNNDCEDIDTTSPKE